MLSKTINYIMIIPNKKLYHNALVIDHFNEIHKNNNYY